MRDQARCFRPDVLEALSGGALLLTVNKRLSRHWRTVFDLHMERSGAVAWKTPLILPLDGWLRRCARSTGDDARMPTPAQVSRVWEDAVEQDRILQGIDLLQVPQTAEAAREAHQLLVDHGAGFQAGDAADDHSAFLRWEKGWTETLSKLGAVDPARLPWIIADRVEEGCLTVPEKIFLAGFDERWPALERLIGAIVRRGASVEELPFPAHTRGDALLISCSDPADEVRRCARWVRRLLDEGGGRIGVVAAGLSAYRQLVQRIFREELDPASLFHGSEPSGIFNLSLGVPLDREGVVRAALDILQVGEVVPIETVGLLLRTPYLRNAGGELSGRAEADRELRALRQPSLGLQELCRRLRRFGRAPVATEVFESLARGLEKGGRRPFGQWAESFERQLEGAGWPGGRKLGSREFQALEQWREVLGQLASLDGVSPPVERRAALSQLRRLARRSVFQPEGSGGPVQVLGVLEAAGLDFDHLWMLGMHDQALPAPPRPNPFIPLPVQRRHQMRHCSPDRELAFGAKLAGRLLAASPDVVASYSRQADGAVRRPSPFVLHLPEGEPEMAPSLEPASRICRLGPGLETADDSQAPPIATTRPVSGGTGILKDQALCPFRAFAHHRLLATRIEAPSIGVDALGRGSLIHLVLEEFWKQTGDQSSLQAMEPDILKDRVEDSVRRAIRRHEKREKISIPPRHRAIEAARLTGLALEWLEREKERAPFAVREIESEVREKVGRLEIKARIDRIDRLEDGACVILDYKTGRPTISPWLDARVTEPQLPIYCLGERESEVAAVTFAQVRRGQCSFRGVGRSEGLLPGVPARNDRKALEEAGLEDFSAVLEHWRRALPRLGDDFVSGRAEVDPVDVESACRWCDLTPLCRVLDRDRTPHPEGDHE